MREVMQCEIPITPEPRECVDHISQIVQALCNRVGEDPSFGIQMLLTAAARISLEYASKPQNEVMIALADALGAAIVAADAWFGSKPERYDA